MCKKLSTRFIVMFYNVFIKFYVPINDYGKKVLFLPSPYLTLVPHHFMPIPRKKEVTFVLLSFI